MAPIDNEVIDLCDSSVESSSSNDDDASPILSKQIEKCVTTHTASKAKSHECGTRNSTNEEARRGSESNDESVFVQEIAKRGDNDDSSASIRSAPRKLPPELHMKHSKSNSKSHMNNTRKDANNNEARRVSGQTETGTQKQEKSERLPSSCNTIGDSKANDDSSILLVGSISKEDNSHDESNNSNDQGKPKSKSNTNDEAKNNCIGAGKLLSAAPTNPKKCDESIISISSTEETSISNKKSIATNPDKESSAKQRPQKLERGASANQQSKSIRKRRSNDGYQLKEGEQIVWATETKTSKRAHQAIIIHPQPARASTTITEDMVFIEWLHSTNSFAWIPKANIQVGDENTDGTGSGAGKRKRKKTKRLADSMGEMSKLACEKDGKGAFISRKKKGAKRGRVMKEEPKLESNQGHSTLIASKKKRAKSRRVTLCKEISYAKTHQSSAELSMPITVVTRDDESSVSSSVSLELPDTSSCSDRSSENEDEHGDHQRKVRFAARYSACCVCESHKHHHSLIEKLLEDLRTFTSSQDEELDWFDIVTDFVGRFKVILQGLEDDSCDGTNIFYHTCDGREAPSLIFTVVKLIQLFDGICQKVSTAFDHCKAPKNDLMQALFRPWERCSKKVGVVLQMMHLVSREIANSREEFKTPTNPEELDQLAGVTFGLQLLQTMARNTYFGCKAKLDTRSATSFQFLEEPLASHRICMKKNCQNQHQRLTVCKVCGIRFHRNCFVCKNTESKVDACPTCKASLHLLDAARTSNLSDVYPLIVERGASPLLPMLSESSLRDTALHVAVQSNNYDFTSMLLFGSFLLLNCDASLSEWKIPDIAWGRNNKHHTPFQSGIDTIIKNMNERPPIEVLLLLCSRGANETPPDIQKALKTRHQMTIVMNGNELDSVNALIKTDISLGLEPQPMSVVSTCDFEPSYDIYIARSIESRSTAIRWFDCCSDFGKQLVSFEGECTAANLSKLHQKQGVPPSWKSYCNYKCPSRSKGKKMCDCQLAEAGVHFKLEVFKTPDGRGFGVRTAKGVSIKKDQVVCHYSGEIITANESKKRDLEYAKAGHQGSYLLDIDKKREYTIDATKFRSVAALINHSCSLSNCKLFRASGNHLDTNFPHVGLQATEDIGELTELTFNYGQEPTGMCSTCHVEHCLCRACCDLAHKKK